MGKKRFVPNLFNLVLRCVSFFLCRKYYFKFNVFIQPNTVQIINGKDSMNATSFLMLTQPHRHIVATATCPFETKLKWKKKSFKNKVKNYNFRLQKLMHTSPVLLWLKCIIEYFLPIPTILRSTEQSYRNPKPKIIATILVL